MKHYHVCTKEGFCPGQARNGWCKTRENPERLKCPHIGIVYCGPMPKVEIDSKEDARTGLDLELPFPFSLWVVQQLMKERRP